MEILSLASAHERCAGALAGLVDAMVLEGMWPPSMFQADRCPACGALMAGQVDPPPVHTPECPVPEADAALAAWDAALEAEDARAEGLPT